MRQRSSRAHGPTGVVMVDRDVDRDSMQVQLLVVFVVVGLAQEARVLFPIMFEIGEDWNFMLAGLVALGTFAAPALMLVVGRPGPRLAIVGGATALGGALLVLRIVDPIPAWLAIGAVAVALVASTAVVSQPAVGSLAASGALVPAVVVGLTGDAALRASFGTWDLAWQRSAMSILVVALITVTIVVTALTVRAEAPADAQVRFGFWLPLGGYMALQLLFAQNLGFVGSQAEVGYVPAVLTVLIGDLLALVAIRGVSRLRAAGMIGIAAGTVVLAVVVSLFADPVIAFAVIGLQVGSTSCVAVAASTGSDRRSVRNVASEVTGGSILFLVLVLLWSLHIDQPLPFPRQVIPALAAAVVASAILRDRVVVVSPDGLNIPMGIVAAIAVIVPGTLWITEPVRSPVDAESEVRLVDYNVRGSVDTNGQLAPDRVVAEIRSSDPDVVVLEEVARGWPIHGTMDLLAYLQRELAMDYVYVAAADGQFGNAVLSRLPMTELDSGRLPDDGTQQRSYAIVGIDVPGEDLTVAVAHTQTRSTAQVSALLGAIDADSRLVVAGDMNIAPDDPEIALFTDAGLVDAVGAGGDPCRTTSAEPTSSCDRPDWVFITPDLTIDDLRIGTGGASDHLAIHVTLDLDA